MEKTQYSTFGKLIQRKLVQMRGDAGLTHRELAEKLEREHSFVWRIEHGERRIDLAEFYWVCEALGRDPAVEYADLVSTFRRPKKNTSK